MGEGEREKESDKQAGRQRDRDYRPYIDLEHNTQPQKHNHQKESVVAKAVMQNSSLALFIPGTVYMTIKKIYRRQSKAAHVCIQIVRPREHCLTLLLKCYNHNITSPRQFSESGAITQGL